LKRRWFAPEEIRYTKAQLLFLLPHLHSLEAGCYPEIENEVMVAGEQYDPSGGGVPGSRIPYKPNGEAMKIASELNTRLDMCGRDGVIVRRRFADKKSVLEVCQDMGLERRWVFHCTQQCLKFIQGPRRPKGVYRQKCIP